MTTQRIEMVDADPPEPRGFASRKFILAVATVAAATGLLLSGRIGEAAWVEVSIWCVGLYMAGNGASAAVVAVWGRR